MMFRNRLLALSAIAALVLGLALLTGHLRKTKPDAAVGSKVLPTLAAGVNDVNEVRVLTAGDKPLVTLKRDEDKRWTVVERDNYPADFQKLREFLVKLSELQVVEVKTSSAEMYSQIGVEDVKQEKATGKRIELGGLPAPLALILGKSTTFSSNYVRVQGSPVSYLAKPQIFVYSEPKVWLDRSLFDLPQDRVQEVRLELADGKADERKYTVTREVREQTDFTVPGLPKSKKLAYAGTANANAGGLANMSFEDVRAAKADEKWDSGVARTQYRLFDGTIVTVLGKKEASQPEEKKEETSSFGNSSDKHYVRIEVAYDEAQHQKFAHKLPAPEQTSDTKKPGAAPEIVKDQKASAVNDPAQIREEVKKLNDKVRGWVFEVPSYKYDALFRPLSELLEKK